MALFQSFCWAITRGFKIALRNSMVDNAVPATATAPVANSVGPARGAVNFIERLERRIDIAAIFENHFNY